ncbi:MAG: HPr family phosphocarrier protein [Christensenellales bacterium]|jgi:phosphotransferase system HPr-like phosphotransfer protein
MLKKVVVTNAALDEENSKAVAAVCAKFRSRTMIETGKRTVKGTDAPALAKCGVAQNERVRLIIEGEDEKAAWEALKDLMNTL